MPGDVPPARGIRRCSAGVHHVRSRCLVGRGAGLRRPRRRV